MSNDEKWCLVQLDNIWKIVVFLEYLLFLLLCHSQNTAHVSNEIASHAKILALTEKMNTFIPKIGENKILKIKGINIANVYTEKKVISCGSEVELTSRHNNADT